VGVIQRQIEKAGVTTVSVSLVKEFSRKVRPPRALWVPFPFGRPMGAPNRPEVQRRIMLAALALLARPEGPVLEDHVLLPEEEPLDARNQKLGQKCGAKGCSVEALLGEETPAEEAAPSLIARYDGDVDAIAHEIAQLSGFHFKYRERRGGRTQVGSSGATPDTVVRAAETVSRFVAGQQVKLPADRPLTESLYVRLCVDDLKAYYMESRVEMEGGAVESSAQTNDWFWLETRVGSLIAAARDRFVQVTDRESDPNWIVARAIVPRGYGSSGYSLGHVKKGV
jgi:hypothetical protein